MPCGGAEVLGLDYCDICVCTSKTCYKCGKDKNLGEFDRTKVVHLLKLKENKGRCFACQECNK